MPKSFVLTEATYTATFYSNFTYYSLNHRGEVWKGRVKVENDQIFLSDSTCGIHGDEPSFTPVMGPFAEAVLKFYRLH